MSEVLELSAVAEIDQAPKVTRFKSRTFSFHLSPEVTCEVQLVSKSEGFTVQDIKRLIAMLELQRSFLLDEPLDVTVTVTSPRAQDAVNSTPKSVNVANALAALDGKSTL